MAHILHITCDYQDDIDRRKTAAINNLVSASTAFTHTVMSLNRTSRPGRSRQVHHEGNIYSLYYFALPWGLGLRFFLRRTARQLKHLLGEHGVHPDLIHCHKLSFEGPIGRVLAREFNIPYMVSVRGDTDLKLIRFKPSYRELYRDTLAASGAAFFIAPWARDGIRTIWPDAIPSRNELLPNIVELAAPAPSNPVHSSRLVCVAHLKDYRRKNIKRLLLAIDACNSAGSNLSLDIIGGGPEGAVKAIQSTMRRLAYPERVNMLGHLERQEIMHQLPGYAGLLLPSLRETFGIVYLEALRAGIPFLHSQSAGVDGYFSDVEVSVAVDPVSIQSISAGILLLVARQGEFKTNIQGLHSSGYLQRFGSAQVVNTYQSTANAVIAAGPPA
jgi:glycosyltransferase involved in cell wall biosynthesis